MTPAETQILDIIGTKLAFIKSVNGYSLTIKKIVRGQLTPFQGEDIPAINYWPVAHDILPTEYGDDQHTLRVMIDVRDKIASKRDGNFADQAAKMIADVITVLQRTDAAPKVSDSFDLDFEGAVSAVRFPASGYQIGEGQSPWCGALVEIEIEYLADAGDMFTFKP